MEREILRAIVGELAHQIRHEIQQASADSRSHTKALIQEARSHAESLAVETRLHFEVVAEGLRHDLRAVAEGVVANTAAIAGLQAEMVHELAEVRAMIRFSYA